MSVYLAQAGTLNFIIFICSVWSHATNNWCWRLNEWMAQLMTKNGRGGPTKMAVIASALLVVSGSSTSNVMTTGCTTITLMKNTGYKADFAGAVEAAASTGGQFMPPVMGVAAFLMSYVTGIPYIKIAIAAIIPAVFYFVSIFIQVDLEARRLDLRPLEDKTTKKFTTNVLHALLFCLSLYWLFFY